jgi:hypothetical protein
VLVALRERAVPSTKANLYLGVGALLLLVLLFVVACILVGHSIASSPLLWLLVLTAGLACWAASARARGNLRKHIESRGMTIDQFETVSSRARDRLGVPKKAWVVRYHDREGIEYMALAVARGWGFRILRDVPRQVCESKKSEWKEEDGFDLDAIREMAKPPPPQWYLLKLLLSLVSKADRTLVLDEESRLADLPDAPAPASFASLLQRVQILCSTAGSAGATNLMTEGECEWLLQFSCSGEVGQRVLKLTLSPVGTAKPDSPAPIIPS